MLVHNKGEYVRHIGARLIPGVNVLNQEDAVAFKEALKHPLNDYLVSELEEITYEDGGLNDLTVPKAIEAVNDTFNLETLEAFKEKEQRKSVLNAIDKQIEAIKNPPKDKIVNQE